LREFHVASTGEVAVSQYVDLSAVPERSRRYVVAIVELAKKGRLSQINLDVLLRIARQLVESGR
jgi:hypothetical protein